ncbi:MAG TPA: ADP-ribosylglycohydrolase family protein [Acidimicrobiales bacterium]|nr:ADP-ribosylglycohydrolase family protein [Acidimicrobiales bacterium]
MPATPPPAPTDLPSSLDRAVGALVGLAAGDAVGTALEFCAPGTFEPITDMVGGGPFGLPAGAFTDDTSMALCLAESIVDTGGMHLADQLRRYLRWRDHGYLSSTGACFDIGGTTTAQLERFRRTGEPVDPAPSPGAAANGSLMRLAPVPIRWHTDLDAAVAMAAESSRTTHAAQRPVDCCRLLGAVVAALVAGEAFEAVTDPTWWRWGDLHPEVAAVAAGSWRHRQPPEIKGSGYCVAALEAALWAVGGAADFADAVLRAANLGDDADTTAAIAGQVAGARWGASGIPARWRSTLVLGERTRSLATCLHAAAVGDPAGGPDGRWPFDRVVHGWWVDPGRVLAGEYPGDRDASRARLKLDVLVDAGMRTFVDLTTLDDGLGAYRAVLDDIAACRALDLRRLQFPIPDVGVIDDDGYTPIVEAITAAAGRGGVYVHCWGGVGRTGTVVGCLLADRGLAYAQIVTRIAEARAGSRKASRPAPETERQSAVIRRRAEHRC